MVAQKVVQMVVQMVDQLADQMVLQKADQRAVLREIRSDNLKDLHLVQLMVYYLASLKESKSEEQTDMK